MLGNTALRVISGGVLGSMFIVIILWYSTLMSPLMLLVGILMLIEWYNMSNSSIVDLSIGLATISLAVVSIQLLSQNPDHRIFLLLYFCAIWSVDTLAMFGGKLIRGPKFSAIISPGKTWSGFVTGVTGAIIITMAVANYFWSELNKVLCDDFGICSDIKLASVFGIKLAVIIACVAILAQLSDLFVSYFKRKHKIKDTGKIIPGHGGVLDRFDSIIITAPVFFATILMLTKCI